MQISIPNPCSQPLHEMKSIEGGVHCDVCSHAVIDFRNWSENEIQDYFKNKPEKTCGIFKKEQTIESKTIFIRPSINPIHFSYTQKFLYALLICFGSWLFSGCNIFDTHITGKPIPPTEIPTPAAKGAIDMPLDTVQEKRTNNTTLNIQRTEIVDPIPVMIDEEVLTGDVIEYVNEPSPTIWFGTVEVMPQFPGGELALAKFLDENIVYPEYEKINQIEGKVYVGFTIDEEGNVIEPNILRGVTDAPNFNDEVLRVIKLMPKWKPSTQGGKPVKIKFQLPIEFMLD